MCMATASVGAGAKSVKNLVCSHPLPSQCSLAGRTGPGEQSMIEALETGKLEEVGDYWSLV